MDRVNLFSGPRGPNESLTRIKSTTFSTPRRHLNQINLLSAPRVQQKGLARVKSTCVRPRGCHKRVDLSQVNLFAAHRVPNDCFESAQPVFGPSGPKRERDFCRATCWRPLGVQTRARLESSQPVFCPSGAQQELDSNQVSPLAAQSVLLRGVDSNQVNLCAAPRGPNKSLT